VSEDERECFEKELKGLKTDHEKEKLIEYILAIDYE
jgi:hypothetical protein